MSSLLDELPEEVLGTITRLAAGKQRPPMTPFDLASALGKAGIREFSARVIDVFS